MATTKSSKIIGMIGSSFAIAILSMIVFAANVNGQPEPAQAKRIHHSLQRFTRNLITNGLALVEDWNENAPTNIPEMDAAKLWLMDYWQTNKLPKIQAFGIEIPSWDYDYTASLQKGIFGELIFSAQIYPLLDDPSLFNNTNGDENHDMLVWKNEFLILPETNTHYSEFTSDRAMSLFAFQGLPCAHTRVIKPTVYANSEMAPPSDAVYYNDWTHLHEYQVRDKFERYGAVAYFNATYEIVSIYVSYLDEQIKPGDSQWPRAKYVWKISCVVGISVQDHFTDLHLVEATSFATAVREELSANHPFRRLLEIFSFLSIRGALGGLVGLATEYTWFHRLLGFEYGSLVQLFVNTIHGYEFKALHQRIDPGMSRVVEDVFPVLKDAKQLFESHESLITSYIDVYYHDNAQFEGDAQLRAFYETVAINLKVAAPFSRGSFVYLVSSLITSVTGWHELVSAAGDILVHDVTWFDTKIYKETEKAELQQSKNDFALTAWGVMITGRHVPPLLNEFKHVLLNDNRIRSAENVVQDWQNRLSDMANTIEQRNNNTNRLPFNACNPDRLECSASR